LVGVGTISDLAISPVRLWVVSLERSLHFYQHVLGLAVLEATASSAMLGVPGRALLHLTERPGAGPSLPASPDRSQFALFLPYRAALAQLVRHLLEVRYPLDGVADHLVSEALYLTDPDGHGIEVYADRPREQWRWDGPEPPRAVDPLNLEDLLAEPHAPWGGMPDGTTLGQVHLRPMFGPPRSSSIP
jgi:catechol 2,3-dioxygenase